ncbi:MAG: hypothetical protein OSJ45_10720 [Lachnospiraceae bacterium]|nr:hypothetical protein [Lachnospiraceae bacterium]
MNGFITTDGSFGNHAGRTYSANGRSRTTAAARKNAASAYSQAGGRTGANSAQGVNNSAYALPGNFARISSIVSQEDIGHWMQDESVNNGEGMAESTVVPQGNAKDFNAAQEAYGKQAQAVSNANGLQDALNSTGTADKTGQQEGVMTDEELALLAEEEEGKKGRRTYGFNEEDIDYMNRLLEDMKKARERYRASNEKNKTAKKPLNYQFKKVSVTISKAKNVTQAGNAVYKAKNALVNLRRKSASGKYDSQEITMAITHAGKMVRIAKVKLAHMKEEEAADKYGSKDKVSVDFREQRKKERRRDEDLELLKADMEYLKAQIKYIRSGGGKGTSSGAMNISMNTAINASYSIMRKEAIKESIEEFLENNDSGAAMASIAESVDAAVSAAQQSGSQTVAASAITGAVPASVPSGGFTTLM